MSNKKKNEPSYIVAIGGSAGGLEAFEEFFTHIPADSGMAFVVVQHLDPTHKGMLPELLQRYTSMPAVQIEDGMQAEPNSIYVIPPNKDISILNGALHLLDPTSARGFRLPIDFFLKQLAQDQGEKAVAVILSGMGTDGTSGLKSIKEKLGMVMVQEPRTAKFDGMPNSALATGVEDYVAPAGDLPAKLMEYAKHRIGGATRTTLLVESKTSAFQKIIALLRTHTQQDFSLYKKDTLNRRIKRRMDIHLLDNPEDYVRYLRENPHELDLLFKEMLIGVTSFFRDPEAFESLKAKLLARLQTRVETSDTIRAWIVGCSTGEEAYSIAIILRECLDDLEPRGSIDTQIFATDIDKDAIEKARRAVYPANIAAEVTPERLQRFFARDEDSYRVKKEIRDSVVFALQNVTMDPPFTKMDLVSCRNLLIYFSPELQQKILPLFHYSLKPGGIMFLGPSESVGGQRDLFAVLDNKEKVFERKVTEASSKETLEFPLSRKADPVAQEAPQQSADRKKGVNAADIAQRILVDSYTPAAVLIDEQGEILYFNGRTNTYLEPPLGKANLNIYAMARDTLRNEIGMCVRKALTENADFALKGLKVGSNGGEKTFNLTVKPLTGPDTAQRLLMVVFEDVQTPKRVRRRKSGECADPEQQNIVQQLEEELKYSKERLQDTVEEMQATSEELQSSNEELQSSNEELQSTNEELTTSKEEMQSLNEELATVNGELQVKVDLLSQVNNDMKNLLNSTQIATIFLDNNLKIKRYTSEATKIIKLIETDVGRPMTDLVSNIEGVDLARNAQEVLETLAFKEIQVRNTEGRQYAARILPYRTLENMIDGVVLTFIDVTDLANLENMLIQRDFAKNIVNTVREPLLVLDGQMRVEFASQPFYRTFKVSGSETEGQYIYDLGNGQWDIPALKELLENLLPETSQINDFMVEHDFPSIGHRKMLLNAREVRRESDERRLILLAIEDVTGTVRAE